MKILMVCLGNICRSPLAEGIMQHKAAAAGLRWTVDSAGTGNWHVGEAPHRLSQKTALQYGIDISQQQARQFRPTDMAHFDRVFFMDQANYNEARRMAGSQWNADKAMLLLEVLHPGEGREVPDPYYGTESDYHHVFHLISQACDAYIARHQPAHATARR
jgi:protein-tyrosine phosphatase